MNQALRAAATNTKVKTIFDYLQDPRIQKGLGAVAGKFLTADRMLRLCTNAVRKTPDLAKCDPMSVLGAMMSSCALQLEPNTPQQQAFLIPYKRWRKNGEVWVADVECQFQIGARGFITLAYRSPVIQSIESHAIRVGDHFKHQQGSRSFLEYEVNLESRGALRGAFSYVRLKDGTELSCVLPLDEIMKIRARSETWRKLVENVEKAKPGKDKAEAERKLAETPWVMWEDDMASKSGTKKHAKQLPLAPGDAMTTAADIDDAADAGVIDLAAMANVDQAVAVARGEEDVPRTEGGAIEHDTSDRSFDGFGQREREAVHVEQKGGESPAAKKAAKGAKDAPAKRERTYADLADEVSKAKDRDEALIVLDGARSVLAPELLADLAAHVDRTHPAE